VGRIMSGSHTRIELRHPTQVAYDRHHLWEDQQ